jgi:hypothetical protein
MTHLAMPTSLYRTSPVVTVSETASASSTSSSPPCAPRAAGEPDRMTRYVR